MEDSGPRAGSWKRDLALVVTGALLVLVGWGVAALAFDLTWPWIVAVALLLGLAVVARVAPVPSWLRIAGLAVGVIVVPVLVLLGLDAAWAELTGWRPRPWLSLGIGALVIGVAAWAYLRPLWGRRSNVIAIFCAIGVVELLVLLPPAGFWLAGVIEGSDERLRSPPSAVSNLEVVVLREDATNLDVLTANVRGWNVTPRVGRVIGDRIEWGRGGPPSVVPPADTDRVLLLLPDGGPEAGTTQPDASGTEGEIDRWLALADEATAPFIATFAVVRAPPRGERLAAWSAALGKSLEQERRGEALSFQDVPRARSVVDLAVHVAGLAPTSDQDMALAARHRPALFFSSDERFANPLNIDKLLSSGKLKLCGDRGQALGYLCDAISSPSQLNNGAHHLVFDVRDLVGTAVDSTIYVNVRRTGNRHDNAVFLDYWWYFPHNPTGAGKGAFCGAGFVLAGVTCHDHQSDWEGVTVVVDEDAESLAPTAVHYAQHDGVARYEWDALQKLWDRGDRKRFGAGIDTTLRPLVFVAEGTHASYPRSCSKRKCPIPNVPGISPLQTKSLKENTHDGTRAWAGNDDAACRSICLDALPTRGPERDPARWNAFLGRWGVPNCVMGVICTQTRPPQSPSEQGRYERPWCAVETIRLVGGDFDLDRHDKKDCENVKPAERTIRQGENLVALGDSFSSGQGAGNYEAGTDGGTNTCYRSPQAWPALVARRLRMHPLPSLACSGAVTEEVLTGRRHREAERELGQIDRVSALEPDVVTLTIGGNDARFATVLRHCVFVRCLRDYKRGSRDTVEGYVDEAAARLPAVYEALRVAAPEVPVVVVGYPRLFTQGRRRAGPWATASSATASQPPRPAISTPRLRR